MTKQPKKDRNDYRTMSPHALIEEAIREMPENVDYRELAWAMAERLKEDAYY